MELHGAKDYFDCTKAIIATDGTFLTDAIQVAEKLNIDIIYLDSLTIAKPTTSKSKEKSFDDIWLKYIIPLQGKTLTKSNGETNSIIKADWSGVERITSNGKNGKIKISNEGKKHFKNLMKILHPQDLGKVVAVSMLNKGKNTIKPKINGGGIFDIFKAFL